MLKLSKKWDYAIKAMVYIAKLEWNLATVQDIAQKEWISQSLLRRIIADLEKTHLVSTKKGRWGWVFLWKKVFQISLYDILSAVWEELSITSCTRGESCNKHSSCSTTSVFHSLQIWFNTLLKIYTLEKIIKK